MLWFVFASATAVFWGLGYALCEKVLHSDVSISFYLSCIYLLSAPVFVLMTYSNGSFRPSLEALADQKTLLIMLGSIVTFIFGNLFIMQAIHLKNATYANLIEIAYPLFTVLFTYLIFRTAHLDWSVVLGGLLIISGSMLIIYKAGG